MHKLQIVCCIFRLEILVSFGEAVKVAMLAALNCLHLTIGLGFAVGSSLMPLDELQRWRCYVGRIASENGSRLSEVMAKDRLMPVVKARIACYIALREAGLNYVQTGKVMARNRRTIAQVLRNNGL